jgi:hypothetical protein
LLYALTSVLDCGYAVVQSVFFGFKGQKVTGMPEARNNEYKTAVYKLTMNTPLTTIFFPIRLPSLINKKNGRKV